MQTYHRSQMQPNIPYAILPTTGTPPASTASRSICPRCGDDHGSGWRVVSTQSGPRVRSTDRDKRGATCRHCAEQRAVDLDARDRAKFDPAHR